MAHKSYNLHLKIQRYSKSKNNFFRKHENPDNYRTKMKILLFLFLILSATSLRAYQEQEDKHTIYVSSLSWHTGIVVPAESFPDSLWREGHNYENAHYLEIGWGDADFFTQEAFNIWYALKAVFWPTPTAIQIKPIYQNAENHYYNTNVAKIEISDEQLQNLTSFLVEELELDENGKIIPAKGDSGRNFYKGSSSYYFPKNSNVWAARALKKAGFSINPIWYQTTGQVVKKASKIGEMIIED